MSDYYRLAKESDFKDGVSLYRGGPKKVLEPAEPITVKSYTSGKLTYIGRSGVTVTQDVDVDEPYYALQSKSGKSLPAILWVRTDSDNVEFTPTEPPTVSQKEQEKRADEATGDTLHAGRRRTRKSRRRRHHRKTRRSRK
jgi:hypothetical protein